MTADGYREVGHRRYREVIVRTTGTKSTGECVITFERAFLVPASASAVDY